MPPPSSRRISMPVVAEAPRLGKGSALRTNAFARTGFTTPRSRKAAGAERARRLATAEDTGVNERETSVATWIVGPRRTSKR